MNSPAKSGSGSGSAASAAICPTRPVSQIETVTPQPHILALATSGAWCSVALQRPLANRVESQCISVPGQARQSANILAMIDEVCRDADLDLAALDAIAFDAGPGSFTGLRIACAVAQGLGFTLDIPLLPVGSLRTLAWQRVRIDSGEATVLVANDARMNELYMASCQLLAAGSVRHETGAAARLVTVRGPVIVPRAQFAQIVEQWSRESRLCRKDAPILRAGDAWPSAADTLAGGVRNGSGVTTAGSSDGMIRADAVAELGRIDWFAGCAIPAAAAAPFYLREKVALDLDEQRSARG